MATSSRGSSAVPKSTFAVHGSPVSLAASRPPSSMRTDFTAGPTRRATVCIPVTSPRKSERMTTCGTAVAYYCLTPERLSRPAATRHLLFFAQVRPPSRMKSRQLPALFALALSIVLPLRGDCPFGLLSPSHYNANVRPGDVASGDFNKDGYLDLAVVNRQTSTISILLGAAGGTFGAPSQVTLSSSTQDDILAADFNKDGNIDLVVAEGGTYPSILPQVEVFLGYGDGTFHAVAFTGQQYVRN